MTSAPSQLRSPAAPLSAASRMRGLWPASGSGPRNPTVAAIMRTVRNPMGLLGATMLGLLVLVAVLAPLISPYDPLLQHPGDELLGPGGRYPLGTDQLGRDLLSRMIFGAQNSLFIGVAAVVMGAGAGIVTGTLAGFLGGWVETVIMRVYDAMLAFPAILLGIAVVTVLGAGRNQVAIALAIAATPTFARLARSTVLAEREREYVTAAECIGAASGRIMFRHVLPNAMAPLLVSLGLSMGFSVLAESGLSFLGLGTQPPNPSWGAMLNDSRSYLNQSLWFGVVPGLALAFLLLSLNYLTDALRDALDPQRING